MVEIIGEIGTNHNGNLDTAFELIDMAAESGIDTIKFQIYNAEDIVSPLVKTSFYGYNDAQYPYWKDYINHKLITPREWLKELVPYAKRKSLHTLATAHSIDGANYCLTHGIDKLKIASMDCNYYPFLSKLSKLGIPLLLSTGMATQQEVIIAVDTILQNQSDLTLFHCTSTYPTQYNEVNLEFLHFLKMLVPKIGLSDHSEYNDIAMMSIVYGVSVIEKHITLDKNQDGPDHPFALDKAGLINLVASVKHAQSALGTKSKKMSEEELVNRQKYRRVAIAAKALPSNHKLQSGDYIFARPQAIFFDSIDPESISNFEELCLTKDIKQGEAILVRHFKC